MVSKYEMKRERFRGNIKLQKSYFYSRRYLDLTTLGSSQHVCTSKEIVVSSLPTSSIKR